MWGQAGYEDSWCRKRPRNMLIILHFLKFIQTQYKDFSNHVTPVLNKATSAYHTHLDQTHFMLM